MLLDCLGLLQGTGDMQAPYATVSMLQNILCVCLEHFHDRFMHEELVRTLVHLEPALHVSSVVQQQVARNVLCCLRTTFTHEPTRVEPVKLAWLRAWAQRADETAALVVWDEAASNGSVGALLKKMQGDNREDVLEMLMEAMCLVVWRQAVADGDVEAARNVGNDVRSMPGRGAVCSPDFLQRLLRPYFRPASGLNVEKVGMLLLGIGVFAREALHESGGLVRRVLQKIAPLGKSCAKVSKKPQVWQVVEALLSGATLEVALEEPPPRRPRTRRGRLEPGLLAAEVAVAARQGSTPEILVVARQELECVVCLEEMDEDDEDAAFCCASAYSLCAACAPVVQQCVICRSER